MGGNKRITRIDCSRQCKKDTPKSSKEDTLKSFNFRVSAQLISHTPTRSSHQTVVSGSYTNSFIHVCIHIYMYKHIYVYMYMHIFGVNTPNSCPCPSLICLFVCVCVCVCVRVYCYVCVSMYMRTSMCGCDV